MLVEGWNDISKESPREGGCVLPLEAHVRETNCPFNDYPANIRLIAIGIKPYCVMHSMTSASNAHSCLASSQTV